MNNPKAIGTVVNNKLEEIAFDILRFLDNSNYIIEIDNMETLVAQNFLIENHYQISYLKSQKSGKFAVTVFHKNGNEYGAVENDDFDEAFRTAILDAVIAHRIDLVFDKLFENAPIIEKFFNKKKLAELMYDKQVVKSGDLRVDKSHFLQTFVLELSRYTGAAELLRQSAFMEEQIESIRNELYTKQET